MLEMLNGTIVFGDFLLPIKFNALSRISLEFNAHKADIFLASLSFSP
jgi:hypothetical protein